MDLIFKSVIEVGFKSLIHELYFYNSVGTRFYVLVTFLFIYLSKYDICIIEIERLLIWQGSILNGQGYIFAIIVFSVVYNIIKFFEFETVMSVMQDDLTGKM